VDVAIGKGSLEGADDVLGAQYRHEWLSITAKYDTGEPAVSSTRQMGRSIDRILAAAR